MIIWFTGLSGSGKTTLSNYLKERLEKSGHSVYQVDGDVFRKKEKSKNAFTKREILSNNYKIISLCRSVRKDYDFVIVSVVSPYRETRRKAREAFGKEYLEVFLNCSLEKLIERDPKKLYEEMRMGKIKNLIGFSPQSPYERPVRPDLLIDTSRESVESCSKKILGLIKEKNNL